MSNNEDKITCAKTAIKEDVLTFILGLYNSGNHHQKFTGDSSYCYTKRSDTNFLLGEIQRKFGLRRFNLICCLDRNEYYGRLGQLEKEFHDRFPRNCVSSINFTFHNLATLIEELIRIANVQDQKRFSLTDLDKLSCGLGTRILKLIERYHNGTYSDLLRAEEEITTLLAEQGLTLEDVVVDKGSASTMPLEQDIYDTITIFRIYE